MITVAIAEVFFFVEFNPLSDYTGGENGLPGVPTPSFDLGFAKLRFDSDWSMYVISGVLVFRRSGDRASHRALAGGSDPQRAARQPAARGGSRS